MSPVIQEILQRIESLAPSEREELETLIAKRFDERWDDETAKANAVARARGIDPDDDEAVQALVDRERYGDRRDFEQLLRTAGLV
jgi:hypothetical protein